MSKWWLQFKLEWRFLFFNWFFLSLPILFGLWFVNQLVQIGPPSSEDIYRYAYSFHKIQHTLSLGIAVLVGILLIRRDMQKPSYNWLGSLPVSSVALVTSKFTVGFLYLSLFTLSMGLVFSWFANQREIPMQDILEYISFFGPQYEWSYGVTLALAMFLAVFIPNRIVYLIGFCAWMFGTFFIDIFLIERLNFYVLKTFHLSQFRLDSLFEHEVWGYRLIQEEMWYSRGFVLSFIILLLVTLIMWLKKERPSRTYKGWIAVALVALLVSIIAFLPYGVLWKERYQLLNERLMDAPYWDSEEEFVTDVFKVNTYEIHMHKKDGDQLEVITTITFPTSDLPIKKPQATSPAISFTLNRVFEIDQVTINGEEVEFKRSGDFFTFERGIDPSLDVQTLMVTYHGNVFEWRSTNFGSGLRPHSEVVTAFVKEENLFLPATFAWYPLTGKRYLDVADHELQMIGHNDRLFLQPADFKVTVTGFARDVYSLIDRVHVSEGAGGPIQTFHGDQVAGGVTLLAGNLVKHSIPDEELTIYTSPSNKIEGERFLTNVSKVKKYFETWVEFPEQNLSKIYYLSDIGKYRYRMESTDTSYLYWGSRNNNLDDFRMREVLSMILFQDTQNWITVSDPEYYDVPSLVGEIRQAFFYLYLREELGLTYEEIRDRKHRAIFYLFRMHDDEEEYLAKIINDIDQGISAGKIEQVKQVLNYFYKIGLTFGDWVGNEGDHLPYPIITLEDWEMEWERVMGDE